MADEISQVQQTGVNPLWPVGGAVVGGAGTYYGVNKYASAPYSSHTDLVKETNEKDKVEFNQKAVNGEGQENALKAAEDKFKAAEAKYDADLKAYQEANAGAKIAELPQEHDAMKNLKKAQEELEAKKNELIEAKLKNIAPEAQAERQRLILERNEIRDARKAVVNDINEKLAGYAAEKNSLAEEFANASTSAARKAEITDRLGKIQGEIANLANNEALGFGENVEAKKQFIANMNTVVENIQSKSTYEGIPKEVQDLVNKEKEINSVKKQINKQFESVRTIIKSGRDNVYTEIEEAIAARNDKALKAAIAKMPQAQQDVVTAALDKDGLINKTTFRKIKPQLNALYEARLGDNEVLRLMKYKNVKEAKELNTIYDKLIDGFAKKDKAAIKDAIGELQKVKPEYVELLKNSQNNNGTVEGIRKAVQELQAEQTKQIRMFEEAIGQANRLEAEIVARGGEGAKLKRVTEDGQKVYRLVDKEGNVVTKQLSEKQAKFRTWVGIPEDAKLKALNERIAELKNSGATREEIAQALKESEFAKELEAVRNAESAVTEARNALPKIAEKTPEQLAEEFAKTNGTKKEAITKALKESEAELKPLFEKKWGNGKIAAAVAGGAAAVGLLAYLMAPKGDKA